MRGLALAVLFAALPASASKPPESGDGLSFTLPDGSTGRADPGPRDRERPRDRGGLMTPPPDGAGTRRDPFAGLPDWLNPNKRRRNTPTAATVAPGDRAPIGGAHTAAGGAVLPTDERVPAGEVAPIGEAAGAAPPPDSAAYGALSMTGGPDGKSVGERVGGRLASMKSAFGAMNADAGALGAGAAGGPGSAAMRVAPAAAPPAGGSALPQPPATALEKRPDLYSFVAPDQLRRLKSAVAGPGGAESPHFKHMGVDARTDIAYTKSCAKVSGDCNPHAVELRYKKDDKVSPETLKVVYDAMTPEELAALATGEKAGAPALRPRKPLKFGFGVVREEDAPTGAGVAQGTYAAATDEAVINAPEGFSYRVRAALRRASLGRKTVEGARETGRSFPFGRLAFALVGLGIMAWLWRAGGSGSKPGRVLLAPSRKD